MQKIGDTFWHPRLGECQVCGYLSGGRVEVCTAQVSSAGNNRYILTPPDTTDLGAYTARVY